MASCMAAKKMEEVTPEHMRLDEETTRQMWNFFEIFLKEVRSVYFFKDRERTVSDTQC